MQENPCFLSLPWCGHFSGKNVHLQHNLIFRTVQHSHLETNKQEKGYTCRCQLVARGRHLTDQHGIND